VKFVVTVRHHLPRVTIVSSQEIGEVAAVVAAAVALPVLVVATEATTVVRTEGRTVGHRPVLTGGATDRQPTGRTVLSSDRLRGTDVDRLDSSIAC